MCHICSKTFPRQSALKEHLHTHVAKSEQKQCSECGKWLKNDSTLRLHMKSHGSQLFRCPHCDKVYNFAQSLRAHLQSHSDIRPHECLVCGKTFKLKKGLTVSTCHHHYFLIYRVFLKDARFWDIFTKSTCCSVVFAILIAAASHYWTWRHQYSEFYYVFR
jgi:DNA-directed RNA polymerase subunit RPC12/RpoP